MSVIVMVNEKFREGVPPWEVRISIICMFDQRKTWLLGG